MPSADIVNAWFADRIATGAIGRNTEAYNQAVAALPDLVARIDANAAAPAPAATPPAPDPAKTASAAKVAADKAALAADEAAAGIPI